MVSGSIQLPFGFIPDQKTENDLQFNLPLNYKKNLLFDKLPFVMKLDNPAIANVVNGNEADDLSVQKFLLATNLLQDSVQESLNMIVTDGDFNNVSIRSVLDTKYPSVMKKPNPIDFVLKDKAKFDVQNPVIGSLFEQIRKNKKNEFARKLLKLPTTDAQKETKSTFEKIADLSSKIRKDDVVDDDDAIDDDEDSVVVESSSKKKLRRFLFDTNAEEEDFKEIMSEPISIVRTPGDEKVTYPHTVTKLFPDAIEIKEEPEDDYDSISEVQTAVSELNDGNLPYDLQFFSGGEKMKKKLFDGVSKNVGIINDSNQKFLEFLTSNFGKNLLTKNKIQIHIDSRQIFHDNKITSETLYDFLKKQQDLNKKELKVNLPIGDDFDYYVREILTNIKDDTFDLNLHSTSKFLFYNFNTFRSLLGKEIFTLRHSIIANDEYALETLQNRNWSYFIKKLIYFSNNDLDDELFQDGEYDEQKSLVDQTFENLNYCKQIYQNVFDDLAYFFHRKLKETPDIFVEKMKEDLAREIFYQKKIKEQENSTEVFKNFNQFFFKTGRFPGSDNLAIIPSGIIPAFVKTKDVISPSDLYETFKDSNAYGLVSTQFLAALNIYFNGDKLLSKNVMTEFLHNLSLQALNRDDNRVQLKFGAIIALNRKSKALIRDDNRNRLSFVEFKPEKFKQVKNISQKIEEEVVNNIITDTRVEYPIDDFSSYANTASEIENENKTKTEIEEKSMRAFNAADEEISRDIIINSRKDLINSLYDIEGEKVVDVLNNIVQSFETGEKEEEENRFDQNLNDINETIKKDNQQFLTKTKETTSEKTFFEIPMTPASSPTSNTLTDLFSRRSKQHLVNKKPYDK